MSDSKKVLIIILLCSSFVSNGQETPVNPISHKIFTPFIFNPAITGSKDFLSLDLIAGVQNKKIYPDFKREHKASEKRK